MRRICQLTILTIAILFISNKINAQFNLTITECTTVEQVEALIDTVFLEGVNPAQIKNITFTGDPKAVGYFNGGYIFGFQVPQGILLSSGFAGTLDKANNCAAQNASGNTSGGSDPDLNALTSLPINDACVIEFDFKPSGDSAKFNYIFGSEEYHDYVNTTFNDVFGFFLSGPGITGVYTNDAINIAEVPGTHSPVSINNVNCGNVGPGCDIPLGDGPGCVYLVDNTQQALGRFQQIALDAYTVPFVADNGVESCEWYHIKLAIGDAGDGAFDSGVFLEKGSFDPGNVECNTTFTHPTVDSLLYESCNGHESVLYFSIGSLRNDPYVLPFTVGGTAERNVDYQIISTHTGDTIYIAPGSLVDSIRIRTYADAEVEVLEDVQIQFNPVMCGFGAPDTAIVWISDLPPMDDTLMVFNSYCEQTTTLDFGNSIGGVSPYTFDWYNINEDTPTVNYTPSGDNYYEFYCIINDTCGQQVSDTAVLIVPDLNANAGPDQSMCNEDSVQIQGSAPGAQQFLWVSNPFDNSLVGKENQDTAYVYPVLNTDYYLTVSDNCTNNDVDTTHVSLDEAVANAGPDDIICFSDSTTLTANGTDGYSWQWSASPGDPGLTGQENNQEITISPTGTTVYTVVVTNDCGFSASDAAEITVNPLPNANAGPDNAVCFGLEFQLNASGGTEYLWTSIPNDPTLTGQTTIQNPIVNPPTQEPYQYYVQVWDENLCTNVDSMILQVDPVPSLSLSADNDLLCYGESVTLAVVGDANYTWTAEPGDPTLTGQENNQTIIVTPLETTVYKLVGVVAGFDCPATLTQTVEVKPELLPTFEVQADEICQGQTFTVMYTGNANVSANYTWDFNGAQIIVGSGGGPYDISWDTDGLKTISLSIEEDGCFSELSSTDVSVLLTPVSGFDANVLEGCVPFTVDFNNTSSNLSGESYTWFFGTGDESTSQSPSFTYNEPGLYTIRLVVTNNEKCSNSFSQTDYIKANETPTADFEPVPPETVLEEPTIDFTNNSSSNESLIYDWDFGDGSTSAEQSPSHPYSEVGIYTVKLLVTTPNGCENEIEKQVIVHPDIAVHAPTAFTPNGDGLNDVFDVKGVGINEYILQVYSRWGELIYESKNLEDQWDGKFNGELVPAGTYVYTINFKSMLNRDFNKKGSVTVVR